MTEIVSFVGVYDANSTLSAEVAYWVGARLGRRHCSLCDITHSAIREKPSWKACRAGLPVPFEAVHLDERDDDLATLTSGAAPCVVVRTDEGDRILLDAVTLQHCEGEPANLIAAIEAAAASEGLSWPGADSGTSPG